MDTLLALGKDIPKIAKPTFKVYAELLNTPKTAEKVRTVQVTTYSYGKHEKQRLDVYTPSPNVPIPGKESSRPILIFFFGGGFVTGGRTIPEIPGDLVYRNLGYFFAERLGYEVIVPGYRLISDGAKFPSGAEDVQGVWDWVQDNYSDKSKNITILGNSAGGVHVASWVFGQTHLPYCENVQKPESHKLKIIFLGTPFEWDIESPLKNILIQYYGGEDKIAMLEPAALVKRFIKNEPSQPIFSRLRLLIVVSQLDPEPIESAGRNFVKMWSKEGGQASLMVLDGHNHFSPPLALGTGILKDEKWGWEVSEWMIKNH